ncbi:RNA-dependent DNA polymerase [Chlorobium sp. BLA1]|uniref:RNA-directed DNA polymerase n=1 Tax=Candidatus Chlorobium masyuteum TaxID=2716876 RepID=UPI0014202E11|nr:RNA-directed DNA polymerase [Candidatus Chlorobium masyuteum]NHQ61002.1 RNA-dependent DNA polymerase [Candidatus Chlorobium masyuteum]
MKRSKNLFDCIISFENMLSAAHKAAKGKRENLSVLCFFAHFEENLWEIIAELKNKTYQPGSYKTFSIYKPKPRQISAAPFRDRVVHHALIAFVGPILERTFIFDTYANRTAKGTHKAIERYQHFLKKYQYGLKFDIRKYFPSIDHNILKTLLRRKISCADTLWLIDLIIDNSNAQAEHSHYFPGDTLFTPYERRRGLPIGNLTSQWFANYYLSFLDHYIKEQLRCRGYVRYVDDGVLFSNEKVQLWAWKEAIEEFLQQYRLILNPQRTELYPSTEGKCFLGQKVYHSYRKLPSENVRRAKKRIRSSVLADPVTLRQSLSGWVGHARQADTRNLLHSLGLLPESEC